MFLISDKVILENRGMLMFIYDCYKNQNMCSDAVDIYSHAFKSDPDCYKTPKNV